jgi:DNA-binding response OmpR family regulator
MLNEISTPGVREPLEALGIPHKQPEDALPDPERTVTVLAVSPHEEDHILLRAIFGHSNWQLRTARHWHDAQTQLTTRRFSVVVSDAGLPDADWKGVLNGLAKLPDSPVLIVSSRTADERLWAEVLNLGAYDLLMKPFDQTEVVRVIGLAWLNWKRAVETARKSMGRPDLALASGM